MKSDQQILVVEDDAGMGELLRDFLVHLGFKVMVANTGKAALKICAKGTFDGPIDLLLCDVKMSPIGGLEITEKLLKERPDFPIILFSAFGGPELEKEARKLGARRLLTKPFELAEMAAAVRKELSTKAK